MRVFGKVTIGLGAAAAIYFCADMLMMNSRSAPKKSLSLAKEDEPPRVERNAPLVERVSAPAAQLPPAVASAALVPDQRPAEHPQQSDRSAELTATLEGQYSVDAHPTRESADKEKAVESLFAQPELEGKGRLQELDCRETICRGVVRIADEEADNAVFSSTFGSAKFVSATQDAVTIASRQKMPDGSVVATFFIHPQSLFAMMGP